MIKRRLLGSGGDVTEVLLGASIAVVAQGVILGGGTFAWECFVVLRRSSTAFVNYRLNTKHCESSLSLFELVCCAVPDRGYRLDAKTPYC